jgi:hypothetical protein
MNIDQFVDNYPRLYHMAEHNSWDSVRKHGLLSTSALLDLFEIAGPDRKSIESCRRAESIIIKHKKHGTVTIRDQKPICDSKLKDCLVGCSLTEWYETLNSKVFFWPTRERVEGLLSARAYKNRLHTILILDSKSLIEKYQSNVCLTAINSGAVVYRPTKRGPNTFVPFCNWPHDVKPKSGKLKNSVAEVAVEYGIPDMDNYVINVVEGRCGKIIE